MRPGPIRPGDPKRGHDGEPVSWRFNEARADSPGRLGDHKHDLRRHLRASMRPGPIRPGDRKDRYGNSSRRYLLQ